MTTNKDRILPIVGNSLEGKVVALLGAAYHVSYLADLYARMGIKVILPFEEAFAHPELIYKEGVIFCPVKEDRVKMPRDITVLYSLDKSLLEEARGLQNVLWVESSSVSSIGEVYYSEHGALPHEILHVPSTYHAYPAIGYWVKHILCKDYQDKHTRRYMDLETTFLSFQTPRLDLSARESDRTIVVIGTGTASLMLPFLRYTKAHVLLVDTGKFSEYNVVRQWCTVEDVGYFKAPSLARRLLSKLSVRASSTTSDLSDLALLKELLPCLYKPIVVLSTGETTYINHKIAKVLWDMKIPFVVPSALPSCLYWKTIVVDRSLSENCYSCYQGEPASSPPVMRTEAMEVYYGGTQPATVFETLPSACFLFYCVTQLLTPPEYQDAWFQETVRMGRCFLGGNVAQKDSSGKATYNLDYPGEVRTYAVEDLQNWPSCMVCGNLHGMPCHRDALCGYCNAKPAESYGYCCRGHEMLAAKESNEAWRISQMILEDE